MDLASQAASEMDAEKRVALYSQMQQMMVDEAPALWLYQQDTLYAYNSKKVQNWTARTDEVVLMDGVSVAGGAVDSLKIKSGGGWGIQREERGGGPVWWGRGARFHYPGSL